MEATTTAARFLPRLGPSRNANPVVTRRTTSSSSTNEEYHIGRAIRFMMEARPEVTVLVEKVSLAGCNFLPRAMDQMLRSSTVRLHCLTHADTVSDAALRQQIWLTQELDARRRYPHHRPTAIFAVNLKQAAEKGRLLRPFRDALFGAGKLVTKKQVLVCGVPNSGKSSLILPLTKARTLAVKKKRHTHLPKVSSKAGMTLGVKKHVLHALGQDDLTLLDTPGLRTRMDHADPRQVALLLAGNVTQPFAGYKEIASHDVLLRLLLQAVNRHAAMSGESSPAYLQLLGLKSPAVNPATFLRSYQAATGKVVDEISLIRLFQAGEFGGLVFFPYKNLPCVNDSSNISLDRNSAVVYMNDEAKRLIDIGTGKVVVAAPAPRSVAGPQKSGPHDFEKEPATDGEPIIYPPYRSDFKCMQCAGFVKFDENRRVFGTRHTRVQAWNTMDVLSYYSRMSEAFGGQWSGHTRYLFKDSLACTLAIKHKLRSRAAAYKKYNGIKEYPVPNLMRPKRFQIDQPIPWLHPCTRRKKSCLDLTAEQQEKFVKKMERLNVTDHTYTLLRKRGQLVPRKNAKIKPPKKWPVHPNEAHRPGIEGKRIHSRKRRASKR